MTARLPRSWKSLPALATLLDPDRLAELFGAELGGSLRTSRLRYKPGVSAVARVDVEPTGAVHWVAAYAPSGDGPDKLDRILARTAREPAHDRGTGVLVAGVPGRPGARLAVGRIGTDPDLRRPLAALGRAGDVGQPGDPARLLRYNPRRRVVLTCADDAGTRLVTKLTAGPASADAGLPARLAAGGLPVLAPVAVPGRAGTPHAVHYPWFGDGDLASLAADRSDALGHGAALEAAAAAGAALARLHVRGPSLAGPARGGADRAPDRKTASLAGDMSALDPRLAERCARVGRAAAAAIMHRPRPSVLLHGDFSADQVLVDRSGGPGASEVRLADLDRVRTGAAADDLGCFLAVELLEADAVEAPSGPDENALTGALLRGYGSETDLPESSEVLAWAAFHVLARSMEPFRSTVPDWRERTGRRLELAERLVERASRAPGAVVPGARPARSAPPSLPRPGRALEPGPPAAVRVPETVPDADGSPLRVRRAWPGADARLVLELEDVRGRVRAGEAVLDEGPRWSVRVLPYGEDPRLPGLAAAVAGGGRVVVHRHRRRAVVQTPDRFVKFLARGRAAQVAELSDGLHGLGTAAGFAVPAVLGRAEDRVEFSVLPGRSLHELGAAGRADDYRAAWAQWARRWPALATAVPEDGALPEHTAEDEARTLARWAGHLDAFPGLLAAPPGAVAALARRIGDDLVAPPGHRRARAVLHRDLHDKQVLFDGERLGLLDFDTAALGEPELDLANLAVHLDLRAAQGLLEASSRAAGQEAVDAVAAVLGADPARLAVHADGTRLRLACVYAFRPRWRGVAQGLLDGLRP
ncbi:phosphotransferase [Kocuria sabuli]|uniref:phosphotransferase n=1 Tax=Kocuria sabuli TaxID=3071448 RepID=UPI0034D6E10B